MVRHFVLFLLLVTSCDFPTGDYIIQMKLPANDQKRRDMEIEMRIKGYCPMSITDRMTCVEDIGNEQFVVCVSNRMHFSTIPYGEKTLTHFLRPTRYWGIAILDRVREDDAGHVMPFGSSCTYDASFAKL